MIGTFATYLALIGSPQCEEMIELFGPPALVAEVRRHLSRSPAPTCRRILVRLSEAEGGIDVAMIVDKSRIDRTASTPEIAAVLIASWAAEDGPRRVFRPEQKSEERSLPIAIEARDVAPRKATARISSDAELSIGSDLSIWYGTAAHVCWIVSYFCGGGMFRYAHSNLDGANDLGGDNFELTARIDGMVSFDLITLEGQVFAGVGHTRRSINRTYLGPCERFACPESPDVAASRTGISVGAGMGATLRATSWLGIALSTSVSSGPIARDGTSDEAGLWFFRLALGLKIEV